VKQVADGGNEEGRRNLMLVEQPQNPRQSVDRAVLTARDALGDEIPRREIGGRVVDVEAQADGDACAVRPRLRLQPFAGADVKHLRLDLIERQLRPRLRTLLGEERCRRDGGD